jgi:guanylate kinase
MILLISGPSGMGKDSQWLSCAESLGFRREVPYTTRRRRKGEIREFDYHFITVSEFQQMIKLDELLDWDYTLENYYGVAADLEGSIKNGENIVLQVLARMGIRLKHRLKNARNILLLPQDQAVLAKRLQLRRPKYSSKQLFLRILHGLEEQTHSRLFDKVVRGAEAMDEKTITRILSQTISSQVIVSKTM